MASMTFQINDASTGSTNPLVWVTVSENSNGTLTFNVTQGSGVIGDLRGLFFDVADESILNSLIVSAASTDIRIGNDSVKDLGDGANMNGLLGSDKGYDLGIEVGTAGIGGDDIRSFSFTLDSTARDLTLVDVGGVDFAARLTSVGIVGGARTDSSKILEVTSQAIAAANDLSNLDENNGTAGNLFANDVTNGGSNIVTSWSGGAVGAQVVLESDGDILGTLQLNADGNYELDASAADELSEGEQIVYNFTYNVKNQTEATSWSEDSANFTVVINGKNDGPQAEADTALATENASQTVGSVITNDSDVDRLDTLAVNAWSGGELGSAATITNGAGATLSLNADGSHLLDASAADALSEGETITQVFEYTLADNHGATDTATITVSVSGANDGPEANDDAAGSIAENEILAGNVAANDADVDRLDTHTWSLVENSFAGQGSLVMNADGTWSYDAQGAYDYLMDGDTVQLSFSYMMTDNHSASDVASVSFAVTGRGTPVIYTPDTDGDDDSGGGGNDNVIDPEIVYLFNHGTQQYDHGWFPQAGDNTAEGFTGNDTLKIAGYGDLESIAVSEGDFGLGDTEIDDTMFVLEINGNKTSTRTEDVGYLVDYTGLTEEQIVVTGNFNEDNIYFL